MDLCIRKSLLSAATLLTLLSASAGAQAPAGNGVYHPLDQRTPPGRAGRWSGIAGHITPGYFQPVRVELPEPGTVTFFNGSRHRTLDLQAPGQVRLAVGEVYRLRRAGMHSVRGLDLYSWVEVFDPLHPPAGQLDRAPLPIQFTDEEIRFALDGRMVTKVVYLEEPRLAPAVDTPSPLPVRNVSNRKNLIAEADLVGRPMAVIRLGGRLPDINGPDSAFFGSGAPVQAIPTRPADVDQEQRDKP